MNRGNSVAKGTQRPTLIYPSHWPTPEDLLHFVEEPGFEDDWKSLGLNVADDLTALQLMIMTNPKGSPVVKGTGGLRKMRFAPDRWNVGKSGAARVCYAYFERNWTVLLLMAHEKGAKENLTDTERAAVKHYIHKVETYLKARNH